MSMGPLRYLCLRDIFQLRHTPCLSLRTARARFFVRDGSAGLLDESGAIWPVALDTRGRVPGLFDWVEVEFGGGSGLGEGGQIGGTLRGVLTPYQAPQGQQDPPAPGAPRSIHYALLEWLDDAHFVGGFCRSTPFAELHRHESYQQVLRALRNWFMGQGYQEIDAPVCVESGGMERYLNLFTTRYVDYDGSTRDLQLATSPEFSLKKAVARGASRVFSLAPTFRNGGERSAWHRPQFTMLEWYRTGASLEDLVQETGQLISETRRILGARGRPLAGRAGGSPLPPFPDPVPMVFLPELFAEAFGIDLPEILASNDSVKLYEAVRSKVPFARSDESLDMLFWKAFSDVIEPELRERDWVVLTGFPVGYASLAQPSAGGVLAQRFEIFARGVEICNGYVELTDAQIMERRFASLQRERPELRCDPSFEEAMRAGLPPCVGNALGIERLVSVLAGGERLMTGHGLGPFGDGV